MIDQQPPIEMEIPSNFLYGRMPPTDNLTRSNSQHTAKSYCDRALFAIQRGELDLARGHLEMAAEFEPDFADIWVFRACLAEDRDTQRDYLKKVLALDPHHPRALKALGEMDGTLDELRATPGGAELDEGQTTGQQFRCPHCDGILFLHERDQVVQCHHCGEKILNVSELTLEDTKKALLFGNIKRENRPETWNIGKRWLHCTNCNAITTFNRNALNSVCRFCGTLTVIEENVNHYFEQPDMVVPFQVEMEEARQKAAQVIEDRYRDSQKGLFKRKQPRAVRLACKGVYAPFWVFDADVQVKGKTREYDEEGDAYPVTLDYSTLLADVLYFAAQTPSRKLLDQIENFKLYDAVDYDPKLLVEYPAELYDVDLDDASLAVRDKLRKLVISRATSGRIDFVGTRGMTYKLALLPIYVVQIEYADGQIKMGVINGQTGWQAIEEV